jgi:hypothetical protein
MLLITIIAVWSAFVIVIVGLCRTAANADTRWSPPGNLKA